MTVTATEGSGFLPQAPGVSDATSKTNMDKDTFLQLLVAQLKYQDPLNPTDSAEFLAQTAQFTSLEKMEAVAVQTAQSLSAQMSFGASSLVGRSVTYTDDTGEQMSGPVESVRFTAAGPLLSVGGAEIPLNNVVSVGQAGSLTATPPDSTEA
jgi:flagellar basal-body rod modification protein FlgD